MLQSRDSANESEVFVRIMEVPHSCDVRVMLLYVARILQSLVRYKYRPLADNEQMLHTRDMQVSVGDLQHIHTNCTQCNFLISNGLTLMLRSHLPCVEEHGFMIAHSAGGVHIRHAGSGMRGIPLLLFFLLGPGFLFSQLCHYKCPSWCHINPAGHKRQLLISPSSLISRSSALSCLSSQEVQPVELLIT